MDYKRFQNKACLARKSCPLRDLTALLLDRPNTISLAGGLPDPDTFPFLEATVKLRDGSDLQIDKDDMKFCLQYSSAEGFPALCQWFEKLQKKVHNPPIMEKSTHLGHTTISILSGSMDALCKSLEAMTSHGDNILIESPAYPGPVSVLEPLECNMIPVESDADGMDPDKLRQILSRWSPEDAKNPNSDIPKILYCVPTGGNPTGSSLTLKRKQEIYRLAQKYDIMILEDDPYYYIQFAETLAPSFLSLDVDGRVMRFDSLSKLISPGMRLGFLTGPQPIVQKVVYHTMSSTMQPNGIAQMFILALLKKWGHGGFLARTKEISVRYREKSRQCIQCMKKHLTGLVEWTEPSGGMFIWMKVLGVTDTTDLVLKAYLQGVLLVAGNVFQIDRSAPSEYVRVSFALATCKEMDEAFSKLAECVKEELSHNTQTRTELN